MNIKNQPQDHEQVLIYTHKTKSALVLSKEDIDENNRAISLNINTFKRGLRDVNNLKMIEKITDATNSFRHLAGLSSILHPFEAY